MAEPDSADVVCGKAAYDNKTMEKVGCVWSLSVAKKYFHQASLPGRVLVLVYVVQSNICVLKEVLEL